MRGRLVAAAVAAVLAAGAVAAVRDAPPPEARRALRDFDTVWEAFRRRYPYFDLKGVDWEAQRERLRPRAAQVRDPVERQALLVDLLAPLRDVHATLVDPDGAVIRPFPPPEPTNWWPDRWLQEVARHGWRPQGDAWGWARMGPTAYLAISALDRRRLSLRALDQALGHLRESRGLILDLRMNAGGDDRLALELAGRFTDRPVVAQYVQSRSRRGPGLAEPEPRRVGPSTSAPWLRPVVVLTGRGTLSSAETLVAALSRMPHVTVLGDTTGGSSGHPVRRRLSGGWAVTVPRWAARTPEGAWIEGRGLTPDVPLVPSREGLSARDGDPLIAAARRLLEGSGTSVADSIPTQGAGPGAPPTATPANR